MERFKKIINKKLKKGEPFYFGRVLWRSEPAAGA
jgi:hypothetical protein